MQIGVLQCDNVRSSLSPKYGEYPQMFETALLATENKDSLTFRTYKAHEGLLPECIEECDAYIITGSRYSVLDTEILWINQLQHFIVRLNKAMVKTIGFSFGHQIMAVAMDGKVERVDNGWQIGVHETRVIHPVDFMKPKAESFNIPMFCEDQIVKIGETGTVLAEAKCCRYAMVQYGTNMLSMQGHPEFSLEFSKALLNVRQEEFPHKRFDNGMTSFSEKALDGELLFTWIMRFLQQDNTASDKVTEN